MMLGALNLAHIGIEPCRAPTARLVRWAVKDDVPVQVEGSGLIDCHLYEQRGRFVLHLVNLTNVSAWRTPVHEVVPIGPVRVRVRMGSVSSRAKVRSLVSGDSLRGDVSEGWCDSRTAAAPATIGVANEVPPK